MGDRTIAGALTALGLTLGAGALAPDTAVAQARDIVCGGDYVVVPGDTLSQIAVRAYGVGRFTPIFDANRDVLDSPQRLEIGFRLFIPCLDNTGRPVQREAAVVPAPTRTVAVQPKVAVTPAPSTGAGLPQDGTVRLVALGARAPYVGERLPEGGMLTEILQRALLRAPVPLDFQVAFTGGSEVEAVADGGYDLGYPVRRPDCAAATLDARARTLCEGYLFSAPIQTDDLDLFVTRTGDFAEANAANDLFGARVCRPEGMSTDDLVGAGLDASSVSLITARDATQCFRMLGFGDVNVVAIAESEGRAAAEAAGVAGRVALIGGIGQSGTLHVVAPRTNAAAADWIALVDEGLADMRASGEYDAVVDNHLSFARVN